jgi:RimJ/RimL family protein N-acetyltransferase
MTLLERLPAEITRDRRTPVLATERLRLRPVRLADAKAIAALVNDRRIAENTARIPHPYTLADAEAFITAAAGSATEAAFAITLARDTRDRERARPGLDPGWEPAFGQDHAPHSDRGTLIGMCGLEWHPGEEPEIGYWLGVPYWGRGYATEAAHAVIDHAFEDLRLELLTAGARVSNPASRRVLEKCGFQWTGVVLTRIRAIASAAPIDRFRLDRRLWASLKAWGETKRLA